MEYNPRSIEEKWKHYWDKNQTYKVTNDSDKPKYYVLDMFPYPSGSGLHVGHPLGYIASDIFSRYKRLNGFNVLHPMGYDAFGLPAEQYAIQTGVHPAESTADNIKRYRGQMDNLGFSYDWSREVQTSNPKYYRWTQWIFLKLFSHYYNIASDKAEPIEELISIFEKEGNATVKAATAQETVFTSEEWAAMSPKEKDDVLMNYRLAYRKVGYVNWCEALGTVLANDEIKDGLSERGGYPVIKKEMMQWSLRITAYAERLLTGLDKLEWSDALKAMQSNWIGRSEGASIFFDVEGFGEKIEVFTTRPDTIFGATFMVLAPEHDYVAQITTPEQQREVDKYLEYASSRSERERMSDVKTVTGAFTGAYAINPFNGARVPIYIADYVLKDYGTGAIMAVPSDDDRDLLQDEKHAQWAVQKISELEKNANKKPFFMGLGFVRPHTPLHAVDKYFDMFPLDEIELDNWQPNDDNDTFWKENFDSVNSKGSRYYRQLVKSYNGDRELAMKKFLQAYLACIAFVDDQIGLVIDALDKSKLKENTIVVLTSDHGWQMGEKNYLFKNSPWEESARVPLVIRAPKGTKGGKVKHPVSLIDIFPTLIEYCSLKGDTKKNEKGADISGFSLKPFIEKPNTNCWKGPNGALTVVGNFLKKSRLKEKQNYSYRTENFRYILYSNGKEELYDHRNDPYEWNNLAYNDKFKRTKKSLHKEMQKIINMK